MANGFCERCGLIGDFRRHLKMEKGRWLCRDQAACDQALAAREAERADARRKDAADLLGQVEDKPTPGSS